MGLASSRQRQTARVFANCRRTPRIEKL